MIKILFSLFSLLLFSGCASTDDFSILKNCNNLQTIYNLEIETPQKIIAVEGFKSLALSLHKEKRRHDNFVIRLDNYSSKLIKHDYEDAIEIIQEKYTNSSINSTFCKDIQSGIMSISSLQGDIKKQQFYISKISQIKTKWKKLYNKKLHTSKLKFTTIPFCKKEAAFLNKILYKKQVDEVTKQVGEENKYLARIYEREKNKYTQCLKLNSETRNHKKTPPNNSSTTSPAVETHQEGIEISKELSEKNKKNTKKIEKLSTDGKKTLKEKPKYCKYSINKSARECQ